MTSLIHKLTHHVPSLTALALSVILAAACGGRAQKSDSPVVDGKGDGTGNGGDTAEGVTKGDSSNDPDDKSDETDAANNQSEVDVQSQAHDSCPTTVPKEGDACEGTGLCEYGDSIRAECRQSFACEADSWVDRSAACPEPPKDYCPANQPSETDQCFPLLYSGQPSLAGSGIECTYSTGTLCYCYSCSLVALSVSGCDKEHSAHWRCVDPPTEPDCPSVAPNVGTACDNQGLICTYGDPCDTSGAGRLCRNKLWEKASSECLE